MADAADETRDGRDPAFPWSASQEELRKSVGGGYLVLQCSLHSGYRHCSLPIKRAVQLVFQVQTNVSGWGNGSATGTVVVHRKRKMPNGTFADDPKLIGLEPVSWNIGDGHISDLYSKIRTSTYPFQAGDILEIELRDIYNANGDEQRVLISAIAKDETIPDTPEPVWDLLGDNPDELVEENIEIVADGVFVCKASVAHDFNLPWHTNDRATAGIASLALFKGATIASGTLIGEMAAVSYPREGWAHHLEANAVLTQFVRRGKYSVRVLRTSQHGSITKPLSGKVEFRAMAW